MKLNIIQANPAGNTTLFVKSPVNKSDYAAVALKLLKIPALRGEQVAFIVPPENGGDIRIEMMGGEFCGNAVRSAGLLNALERGAGSALVECSGFDDLMTVYVNAQNGDASVDMPLPEKTSEVKFKENDEPAFSYRGITHIIVTDYSVPEYDTAKTLTKKICESLSVDALGIMYLDAALLVMRPSVYVKATDTFVLENSCASGTAAAAYYLISDDNCEDRSYNISIMQPGGTITALVEKSQGKVKSVRIGGRVKLLDEKEVEIEL